jgi:hypothetical protein
MVEVHSQSVAPERGSFHALVGALERAPPRNHKSAPSRIGNGSGNGGGGGGDGGGDGDDLGPLGRALITAFKRNSELQSELTTRAIQAVIEGVGETTKGLGEVLARALAHSAAQAEQLAALAALAARVAQLERQVAAAAGDHP